MNYRAYPTFGDLWIRATTGVQREWLLTADSKPTKFAEQFELSLHHIYNMAMHHQSNYVPWPEEILTPMKRLKPRDVKVIMTAQDPYPEERHADGRAFDSKARDCPYSAHRLNQNGIKFGHIQPENEYVSDYGAYEAQGVLMTNMSLTTEVGKSRAHAAVWKGVMLCAFQLIPKDSVAVLLGSDARSILSALNSKETVEHIHPAARTDEFMDEDLYGKIDAKLEKLHFRLIDWNPGHAR